MIFPEAHWGIHLSLRVLMDSPLPIFQKRPSSRMSLLQRIDLQIYEGLEPGEAFMISEFLKYLAFITLESRRSGLLMILQACLARRALLKATRSLKPISPIFWGLECVSRISNEFFCPLHYHPTRSLSTTFQFHLGWWMGYENRT